MSENLILDIFENFNSEFENFKQNNRNNKVEEYFKQIGCPNPKYFQIKGTKHEVIGFTKNKMVDGKCIIRYRPDDYFIGDYKNNKKHGYGYHRFVNGIVYKGQYDNDLKVGGIVFEPKLKKIIYEGEWAADLYNGKGKLTRLTNEQYIGDFRNGKFHGRGVLSWPNGAKYEGDFVEGVRQGEGRFVFNYGDEFIGQFANNKFNGHGRYIWKNGDMYEGEFVDGVMTGNGLMSYRELGILGSGVWDNHKNPTSVKFDLEVGTNRDLY